MKYGSVCSGVEAASLAWMPLDWECKFVAEIEPFPCAVLQQRFGASAPINVLDPNENGISEADRKMRLSWIKQYKQLKTEGVIPNEGDFTKIGKKYAGQIDLLVGGTPCQDLSVAGKRAGFDGERSSLAIDFVRLAYESQCKWVVWENVPGVFSSNKGRDFARLLSLFTGRDVQVPKDGFKSAGFVRNARRDRYGVAWRVLDAQFTRVPGFPFGVPQRRRRVFVVGYFGDWVRAAQVLLEPSRLSWNTPSRFKARESIAGFTGQDFALASGELCNSATDGGELLAQGSVKGFDCYNQSLTDDVSMTVTSKRADPHHVPCAVQALRMRAGKDGGGKGALMAVEENGIAGTLRANAHGNEQIVCCENHANDSRIKEMGESCQTLNSRMGTGGGNLPLVQECYAIDSLSSNSMKSSNPHSGFHKEDIAKTLDTTNQDATKNQGGNVIVSGFDQYNMDETGDVISSLGTNCGMSTGRQSVTVVHGAETPISNNEHANPVTCNHNGLENCVAIAENVIGRKVENGGNGVGAQEELAYTQNATGVMGVCNSTVRRLIPVECERLMGFPDNHTQIAWNGKSPEDCPDASRYKACGNSMCVNVMRWIGMRIDKVEKITKGANK